MSDPGGLGTLAAMSEAIWTPPGTAPATEPPMFGRDRERRELLDLCEGPDRLVTLTGRGGVGKTRLAHEVLRVQRGERDAWAMLVPLSPLGDPALLPAVLATHLAVSTLPGADPFAALVRVIADDPWFVVLDNFEHLTESAWVVGALVDECPRLRLLVTSQAPLRLRNERVVVLEPLPAPGPDDDLRAAWENPAVQLYCDRASAVNPGFTYGPRNASAIAELCRRLEGLPLAILLAAARAGALPASEILARIDDVPLVILAQPHRDMDVRHHDLRAAIAWTYDLLDDDEQQLLRRLAVVSGPFDADTAAALDEAPVGETLERVANLCEVRLVDLVHEDSPARYSLPWSIRAFAHEELSREGGVDVARRRLVTRDAHCAEEIAAGFDQGDSGSWGEVAAVEEPGLLHGLDAAYELELLDEGLTIITGLAPHWWVRGYQRQHLRSVECMLDLASRTQCETPVFLEALSWATLLAFPHTTPTERGQLAARLIGAREIACRVDDHAATLRVLSSITLASQYTGDFALAAEAAAEAMTVLDIDERPRWRARFEVWSGMLSLVGGDVPRASHLAISAMTRARRDDDTHTILAASMLLRDLMMFDPELEGVVPPIDATLDLAEDQGFVIFEAMLRPRSVVEAIERGDPVDAVRRCVAALDFARRLGGDGADIAALLATVAVLVANGEYRSAVRVEGTIEDALPAFEVGLTPRQRADHHHAIDEARRQLGDAAFEREARVGAQRSFAEGVRDALRHIRDLEQRLAVNAPATPADLTPRQRDTLRLVVGGCTNKEIAAELGISPKTVMHHLGTIYKIAGVRTRTEAAMWATARGLDS
jgi:predicted ATPase/DNA-binding CsgD family transcriptional regulator